MSEDKNTIVSKGTTVEEAISEALLHLGARRDEVEVVVIEEGKSGLFGVFGRKAARVEVTKKPRRRRRRRGGRGRGRGRGDEGEGRSPQAQSNRDENKAQAEPRKEAPRRDESSDEDRDQPREGRRRSRRGRGGRGRGRGQQGRPQEARDDGNREEKGRNDSRRDGGRDKPAESASNNDRNRNQEERSPREQQPKPEQPRRSEDGREYRERRPRPTKSERAANAAAVSKDDHKPQEQARPAAAKKEKTMNMPPLGEPVAVAEGTPRIAAATADQSVDHVRVVTEALLAKCGFVGRVAVKPGEEDDHLQARCLLDMDSVEAMVGRRNSAISSVQHLVDRMVSRSVGEHVPINMDINNYRQRQDGRLMTIAREAMDRVNAGGDDDHLPPMNGRERRVIHMEVAEVDELETYTLGSGMDRHVVITSKLGDDTPASEPDQSRR